MGLFSRKPKQDDIDDDVIVRYASPMAANSARVMVTRRDTPRNGDSNGSNGRKGK